MKNFMKVLGIFIVGALLVFPRVALADEATDRDIKKLETKIDQVRQDYRAEGNDVDQKVQEYKDRIAQIKREAANDKTWKDRLNGVRKDFYEWRLSSAVEGYQNRIEDLQNAKADEANPAARLNLEKKVKELDAKKGATQARLNDLKISDGKNWEKIEDDLDASLREIDREYKQAKQEMKS